VIHKSLVGSKFGPVKAMNTA
jgi:RING finger protein 113A